ncbi:hypothetical protein E2C01_042631 [Portunus trituberculatus]|uniref:Uncharacterized protein n=1 Tax=Portunus trituberculatus TaxID=210409 RepID=A0A5B7FTJ0_PORTR|nr:hypothetical protein [Portunus trituberculatus]
MWLFGDSLMRGVGKEIYSLSKGGYKVMDKSRPGANIRGIREVVMNSLHQMEPKDLVVIEGRGNGLEDRGGWETRRDKEGQVCGRERRWVNEKLVGRLED